MVSRAQAGGFAREDDKDRLGDFLGVGGNPGMAERRRINQVDMPPDQFGKGFLRALPLVIPQQVHVAHIGQLTIYCRCEAKSGIYFLFFAAAPGNRKQKHFTSLFRPRAFRWIRGSEQVQGRAGRGLPASNRQDY